MLLNLQTHNLPAIQHHHPILSHVDGQGGMLGDGYGEERGTLATCEGRAACELRVRARWVRYMLALHPWQGHVHTRVGGGYRQPGGAPELTYNFDIRKRGWRPGRM